jgi:hypothetical protein
VWAWASNYANSHSSEQDTLSTAPLTSKKVVPYRTRGDTYCPRVSTNKIRPLADSSMTIHNTRRIPTVFTIRTYAQTTALNLTTVISHLDGWKTNTPNTQHKPNSTSSRWKTCTKTRDCMAKQYYPSIITEFQSRKA